MALPGSSPARAALAASAPRPTSTASTTPPTSAGCPRLLGQSASRRSGGCANHDLACSGPALRDRN
eukprot:2134939-Alexandrium_andersonii.AAC.1